MLEQLLAAMHAAGRMPKDDRADTCLLQDKMGVLQVGHCVILCRC